MTKSKLAVAAHVLRNVNPILFEDFLLELENYYRGLCEDVVKAQSNDVLQAQGRAQSALALLRTLKECHLEPKKPQQPLPQAPAMP